MVTTLFPLSALSFPQNLALLRLQLVGLGYRWGGIVHCQLLWVVIVKDFPLVRMYKNAITFPNNFPLETTKAKPVLQFRIGGAAIAIP
jgi:hypothetical protein